MVLAAPYYRRCMQLATKPTAPQICLVCLLCDCITFLGSEQLAGTSLMDVFRSLAFNPHPNCNFSHPSINTSQPGERAETAPALLLGCQ